jgi:hypothetical protein
VPAYADICRAATDHKRAFPLPKGWRRIVLVKPQVRQAVRVAQLAGDAPVWAQNHIEGLDVIDCADPEVLGWVIRDVSPSGAMSEPSPLLVGTTA